MKSVTEVRQETAEVLGNAVAEVARRAIRPELEPFRKSLESLIDSLETHAETLYEQVRAEKQALDAVNIQLGQAISTGKSHAAAAVEMQDRVQEVRGRLEGLADELAAVRGEHATTVVALSAFRGDVIEWTRTSSFQTERLTENLQRVEAVGTQLDSQAATLTAFANSLYGRVDDRTSDLLQGIERTRTDGSRQASELRTVLENGFDGQKAAARAAANDVMATLDACFKSITAAFESARSAGSTELAELGAAQRAQLDASTSGLGALVHALRADLAEKVEVELLRAADRLESENRRALDDIAGLRIAAETHLVPLRADVRAAIDGLTARYLHQDRELIKAGQALRRVCRLALVNLFIVLAALTIGGIALWHVAR